MNRLTAAVLFPMLIVSAGPGWSAEVTECDRLTAAPYDDKRVARPVETKDIDAPRAIKACGQALTAAPDVSRLIFQQGRAFYAEGSFDRSVPLFRRAAEKGYTAAEFALGVAYSFGQGVAVDLDVARKWYQRARDKGNLTAGHNLAALMLKNPGKFGGLQAGIAAMRANAEEGFAPSQEYLGELYASGNGVGQDGAEALKWLRKAAAQGYATAMTIIGALYKNGWSVTQDDRKAVAWYRKAAEAGDGQGQIELGYMYLAGRGVVQDYIECYKWYILGIARMPPGEHRKGAIERRDWLKKQMTPADISEAQRRAREWTQHR